MLASRKAVLPSIDLHQDQELILPNIDLNQDQESILPSIDLNDFDELISPSIDEDWNRLFNEYQEDLELRDKGDFIELN